MSEDLAAVNARLEAENILFDTDRAIIKPESNRILDEIAEILVTREGVEFEIADRIRFVDKKRRPRSECFQIHVSSPRSILEQARNLQPTSASEG